jgi:lipoprotein-anchoring transpeptidase ErfK/SrfK
MRTIGTKVAPFAVALALLITAGAQAAPHGFERLSNERWLSHSAYVDVPTWVHAKPDAESERVAWLRARTYHGSLAVVLVLGELERDGKRWAYVRYPGLGDRRGWVSARTLSAPTVHRSRLVVDRGLLRISLWQRGRLVFRAPIGVGASASPTPAGRYYVRERLGPLPPGSIYGALAFGTSAFSPYRTDWPGGGQVGIHGTNQPGLVPGYISNGCVRLRDEDVLRLGRLLRVGTPLLVL